MTGWRKRQVVDMAREAHGPLTGTWWDMDVASLERFAELVRADEREACAKVCDDKHDTWRWDDEADSASGPRDCAEAIRARGQA